MRTTGRASFCSTSICVKFQPRPSHQYLINILTGAGQESPGAGQGQRHLILSKDGHVSAPIMSENYCNSAHSCVLEAVLGPGPITLADLYVIFTSTIVGPQTGILSLGGARRSQSLPCSMIATATIGHDIYHRSRPTS